MLINNQFNWRNSPFVIHGRSWITRFLFLAKTMDHAKNSGFSKLWLLWRSSVAFFFVRRGSVVLCTAVKWTLVHTLYLLIFLFLCRWTSCLFIQTISYFYRTQSNRQTIFNPLSDCNTENIYVSVRYYNIAEKKLQVHIFRDVNFPYL